MRSGRSYFEGALGGSLTADIAEIGSAARFVSIPVPCRRRELVWPGEQTDHLAQIAETIHADSVHYHRFRGIFDSQDHVGNSPCSAVNPKSKPSRNQLPFNSQSASPRLTYDS
jgi:hypothetical protein